MLKFNRISVTEEVKNDLNEARMDSLVQVCYSEYISNAPVDF